MSIQREIVDVWCQHPTKEFINNEMFSSLRKWMKIDKVKEEIPIEFTIASMEMAGVTTALLSAWYDWSGALISNEEVYKHTSAHPKLFNGIGAVQLNRPMKAVDQVKQNAEEFGFIGIRIIQWLWNLPPTQAYYYPIYVECVKRNLPICFQVGHTGPMRPSEVGRPIPYIDQIAIDFPELKIVCGHIGYPWTQEMVAVATKHKNVFIDTSAYSANRYPNELIQYMKSNGQKKVLFGSNFPMITPQKCLRNLDALGLNQEQEDDFLNKNAHNVFNLN